MKLKQNSNRLGIFIFYDRDSKIDDYVLYMLESLNNAVDNIIFVSNSKINDKEIKKIEKYTNNIHVRENVGLDAGAFKYVIDNYGFEYMEKFDEIILLNDTFFGPFKPFKEILLSMENKDLDLWGLTANYESLDGSKMAKDGYIHSHIQTYFVAYRKSLIKSEFFHKYWKAYNVKKMKTFNDVVYKHETYFTYLCEKNGFKWDTYINLDHYKSDNRNYNYNIYGYSAYDLIKYFECPFIKRKNFVFNKQDAMYLNSGIDTKKAIEYISNNTDYDVKMIYDNLFRLYGAYDLYQGLNFNYIVNESNNEKNKSLVYACINDYKAYELSKTYFDNSKCDVELVTTNKKLSKSLNISYVKNAYINLLNKKSIYMQKYEYICLLDLYDEINNFQEVIDSDLVRTLENSISSKNYINGVIDIFNKNKFLSILFLPESIHNKYIMNITGYNFNEITKHLINMKYILGKNGNIFKNYNGVWIRSNILDNLKNYNISLMEFISTLEIKTADKKLFFGKIYNKDYIENDVLGFENIINTIFNSDELKLSYPNLLIQFGKGRTLRKLIRRIVPRFVRRWLKILFRK